MKIWSASFYNLLYEDLRLNLGNIIELKQINKGE